MTVVVCDFGFPTMLILSLLLSEGMVFGMLYICIMLLERFYRFCLCLSSPHFCVFEGKSELQLQH